MRLQRLTTQGYMEATRGLGRRRARIRASSHYATASQAGQDNFRGMQYLEYPRQSKVTQSLQL